MYQRAPYRRAATRFAPAAALLALTVSALLAHASLGVVARFAGFLAVWVTLPGLVLWRLATGRRRDLVEDVAAGTLVGAAALLLVYLVTAPLGLQGWAWLWALPVVVVALVRPGVRRRWWGASTSSFDPRASWAAAIACALPLLVIQAHGPAVFAPAYTRTDVQATDMAFQHALTASARYDAPVAAPFVDGEPLGYHHFVHVLMAALSWATGIDASDLVYVLCWVPLALAGSGLILALVRRIRPGDRWVGPLAVVVAGIGGTVQPFADTPVTAEMTAIAAYLSPTQNLGGALAVLLALAAVDLLRGGAPRALWAVLALGVVAASGAKASVLPLIACGFGLVAVVRLAGWWWSRHRGSPRILVPAAAGAVLCVVVAGIATAAMFGGDTYGTTVRPGRVFARVALYTALRTPGSAGYDTSAQVLTAIVTCLAWLAGTAGLLALLRYRAVWRDPAVVFLAGCGIAGFAGLVLTDHPGLSQLYFHRTALPMIAVLACVGLAQLADRIPDRRGGRLVAVAVLTGLVAAPLLRLVVEATGGNRGVELLWTVTGLVVVTLVVATAWAAVQQRPWTAPFLVTLVATTTAAGIAPALQSVVADTGATHRLFAPPETGGPSATAAESARWLRDNSRSGELVATNAHCVRTFGAGRCDSRHFWIAALTERHILVEGWSYTGRTVSAAARTGTSFALQPYWDPARLAANDRVFRAPTAAAVATLRDTYGVRWLYADLRYGPVPERLGRFATLRHEGPDVRVYELR